MHGIAYAFPRSMMRTSLPYHSQRPAARAKSNRALGVIALAAAIPWLWYGCGDSSPLPPSANPNPPVGTTDFVSADGVAGQDAPENDDRSPPPPAPGAPDEADGGAGDDLRSVEEGDIYRLVGDGRLLNLNRYRGLQIIDINDVARPEIIGRLQVTGNPVEMYVYGDRAIVLLNNWRGYYGQRDDITVETQEGGLVMLIDISNPNAPAALDQAYVPGWIQTSRLTRDSSQAALYVAADEWRYDGGDGRLTETWSSHTIVKSFDVSGDSLTYRTELDLGGYVTAIQATPEVLLVARNQGDWRQEQSDVSVIDIADPDGTMALGDTVTVAGGVRSQFHMAFRNDILHVFSGASWGGGSTNYLQTFDATELSDLKAIDQETFGDGENLFATIFLDNKAFAVTYLRVDPFHAFEVTDAGQITEVSEFIVSGWNDFFRPVMGESRLIGIGVNDEDGRRLAVSMYDTTELSNPEPLIERAEVSGSAGGWNWSEASWDHRAFSVLENAVAIEAATGELETGLVLLPFSGWNSAEQKHVDAVQIFTFSATTLTRRGVMENGSSVRRSFLADADTTANLSESDLSLFDHSDVDNPVEMGRLDLAPNYADIFAFGEYRARVRHDFNYYYYDGVPENRPQAFVEIITNDEHPDQAAALASIAIPAGTILRQMDQLLLSIDSQIVNYDQWPYELQTTIDVYDLGDPLAPVRRGQLVTRELQSSSYDYRGGIADCFDCGWYYQPFSNTNVVGEALTFLRTTAQEQPLGREEVCSTYVADESWCPGGDDCSFYTGDYTCRSRNGGAELCTGGFAQCTLADGDVSCEPLSLQEIKERSVRTETNCYNRDISRYWQQYAIDTVDVSNPDNPRLAPSVELPRQDEGVSVLADGETLHITVKRPVTVESDDRPYVRYYVKSIDFADPAQPDLGNALNVPGELVAVDGNEFYTKDLLWGEQVAETAIAHLEIAGGLAYLQGHYRFPNRRVESLTVDHRGLAIVSHGPLWSYDYGSNDDIENVQKLTLLEPRGPGLVAVSEIEVDRWANLRTMAHNRALFQVPGGILIFDVEDPTDPHAQAYFATRGWPANFVIDEGRIIFAAGRYGIYDFALDSNNLLPSL